jgi:hypothetical protein
MGASLVSKHTDWVYTYRSIHAGCNQKRIGASMTWRKREIMEMAREAGLQIATDVNWMPIVGLEYAEKFAKLVREDEREACAKVCDDSVEYAGSELARQIRARSQTPCTHEWIDATTTKPQWHCAKCGVEYKKEQA